MKFDKEGNKPWAKKIAAGAATVGALLSNEGCEKTETRNKTIEKMEDSAKVEIDSTETWQVTQNRLIDELETKAVPEIASDELRKALREKQREQASEILNSYPAWLRANNYDELENSVLILMRSLHRIHDDAKIGSKEIQKMMMSDADFNGRVRYVFNAYLIMVPKLEQVARDMVTKGALSEDDFKKEMDSTYQKLNALAQFCKSPTEIESEDFVANQQQIIDKFLALQLTAVEAKEMDASPDLVKARNLEAEDFAFTAIENYKDWFRGNTDSEVQGSINILRTLSTNSKGELDESGTYEKILTRVLSLRDFKSRVVFIYQALIKMQERDRLYNVDKKNMAVKTGDIAFLSKLLTLSEL